MTAVLMYIIPKRSDHIGAWLLLGVFYAPVIFLALLLMGAAVALNWLLYGLAIPGGIGSLHYATGSWRVRK